MPATTRTGKSSQFDQKPKIVCVQSFDQPMTAKLMRRLHKAAEHNRSLGLSYPERLKLLLL